jgi:hypothetical protein
MAKDTANADIKDKHPPPDKSEATGAGHCEHCADHHARLTAVETHLGMAPQPGVAAEETGKSHSKEPTVNRERARH